MYDAHAISLKFHRQAYVVFDHGELEESFIMGDYRKQHVDALTRNTYTSLRLQRL